ncbi:helix-turn-helix domain-containing protein [Chryseobacterium sp. RG1]|uniref:Helix-turn-helix domain-containing protein n=1 Tax=Chryseobacterium tagetis TaxID=2801334 RepID=A0ABS7ZV19_9FLAO|nr:helix-turn-helix domain-containing protein [Chryseobacterium tagetis]MCA6065591.1 helix-turn-helix domain-containing protein [Chryseobacterium tagetis]
MVKEKLIKIRKEKKFSQQDIAKYLNISQTQYLRKEKGEIEIKDDEWERIAKLLDVEIDEIRQSDSDNLLNQNFEKITDITDSHNENNNNFSYKIPKFILKNQQDYITILKKEIEILKIKITELKKK